MVPVTAENFTQAQIPLSRISPSNRVNDNPKGLWPYKPYAKTALLAARIIERYDRLAEQGVTQAGPRTIGYRLKEAHRGEYAKADFGNIERVIKRLWQSGQLDPDRVADGSSVDYEVSGWDSPESFLRDASGLFSRDLRDGQPVVIEVGTEARETAGLIAATCRERGVRAYSGGGSSGPGLARLVAYRALDRAAGHGQDTLLLWLGDFDQAGIRNIVRPHIENVAAFLYGTAGNEEVLATRTPDGELVTMAETGCTASFAHLGLSPQMALERAETAELSEADTEAIAAYADSGEDAWSRDLDLLDGVAKFELEAMDPPELRDLLTDAIDGVLDAGQLDEILAQAEFQRDDLQDRLDALADELDGAE